MATKSEYFMLCECNTMVKSHEPVTVCPNCKRQLDCTAWGKGDGRGGK